MRDFWLKEEVIQRAVFPQLPSFCAVAACCGAANALLGVSSTQEQLHERYRIGERTKLHLTSRQLPPDLRSLPRSGPGMSNWDVIRLFNSIMLDSGREPHSLILCGEDFIRETSDEQSALHLFEWMRHPSSQVVVHLVNHYVLVAGLLQNEAETDPHLLVADSTSKKGPLRSLPFLEVRDLAAGDERYGWLLLSDRPIPGGLVAQSTDSMLPREVRFRERFERRDGTG